MTTTNEHTELAELIRLAKVAIHECPAHLNQDWQVAAMRVCRGVAAMLEAQRPALKPLTDEQIAAVAVNADCVWLQKEYTCSFRAIVRATEAAHGIKEQATTPDDHPLMHSRPAAPGAPDLEPSD